MSDDTAPETINEQAANEQAKSPPEAAPCLSERLAAAGELPPELLAFLVRSVPPRALWKWLNEEDRARLLHRTTQGFQRNLAALRQNMVRKRLEAHLAKTSEDVAALIELWAESKPESVDAINAIEGDVAPMLPQLWRRFGGEAIFLSLLAANCDDETLDAYLALDAENIEDDEIEEEAVQANSTVLIEEAAPDLEADLEAARAEAQNARIEAQSARVEAQNMLERAQNSSRELRALQTTSSREIQNAGAAAKATEKRAIKAETELAETRKLLDRTARRQRHVEAERDELAIDAKRAKKQLRQAQQIQEELRKQLASVNAKLEQIAPTEEKEAPAAPVFAPRAPSPSEVIFEWISDGRPFRVSPREVARAISRNDDAFVFHLIQAFDSMQAQSGEYFRLFLKRVREIDVYFERVLTKETTRVLVDASNVVRYDTAHNKGRGRLSDLLRMRDELRLRDCFPISLVADASLKYFIDKPNELVAMANRGELLIADKGVEADEILAREARRSGAYVVTNDRNFHAKVSPDFEPPRITFRVIDGLVVVDDF